MKRTYLAALALILAVSFVVPATYAFAKTKKDDDRKTATVAELVQAYADAGNGGQKVRILVVPGHEPGFGGAVYQGVYEREITVEIADQLAAYLQQNPRFEVIEARSNTAWNEGLQEYFEDEWDDIEDFVDDKKDDFEKDVRHGRVTEREDAEQVDHAAAPSDVALRLYGINRWANEHDIDLVVHAHVNDTTDHGPDSPSAYSGYAVYVPDAQYGNADTSRPVGEAVAARLSAMSATSTLPIENRGVVEDQELIALGAFDTLSVPSVLMEYAYLTEPRFMHPEVRQVVTKDYAYETYLGIQDFFKDPAAAKYPTASLPFTFASSSIPTEASSSPAVYALQAALHTLGFYPAYASTTPANARIAPPTLTMCPIDGVIGPCTTNGIEAFQISNGWETTGTLGPKTVATLNRLFSDQPAAPAAPSASGAACLLPEQGLAKDAHDQDAEGDVTRLQRLLARDPALYPEQLVTGYFGPATEAAVERFQEAHGIAHEGGAGYGLVGPKTLAALGALCG